MMNADMVAADAENETGTEGKSDLLMTCWNAPHIGKLACFLE